MNALSSEQRAAFWRDGYMCCTSLFSPEEVALLECALSRTLETDSEIKVMEADGATVRSVFASHKNSIAAEFVARSERLLGVAEDLLGTTACIYQSKYNLKDAFSGDIWEWHQDYLNWEREDGLPSDQLVTAMLFIDDATEFNAPLIVIPRSHQYGVIDVERRSDTPAQGASDWQDTHAARLRYHIPEGTIRDLVQKHGMASMKGPAGTVCFFHSNLIHGSVTNLSPFRRAAYFVTYNRTDNVPRGGLSFRPDFIVGRDNAPLKTASDTELRRVLLEEGT